MDKNNQEVKSFSLKINVAVAVFLVMLAIYNVILFTSKSPDTFVVCVFSILIFIIYLGFRPYKYTIEKRTLYIHKRLWKKREVDLMQQTTICDPVSRWADIATRPHAIELYAENMKRTCCFPKDRIGFVGAVLKENKRIHCTVKDYTDSHRKQIKRREREIKRENSQNK